MSRVIVDTAAGTASYGNDVFPCRIGRSGSCLAEAKREGDGCTPLGTWHIRSALIRPDQGVAPPAQLPWRWLRPADGWSDDPADGAYNRPVRHPHPWSAERLWRGDRLYDVIIVLGHNDDPPRPGCGSAIFLHLAEDRPTEGCVAIHRTDMQRLLTQLGPRDMIEIM